MAPIALAYKIDKGHGAVVSPALLHEVIKMFNKLHIGNITILVLIISLCISSKTKGSL